MAYSELAEHIENKELDGPGQWAVYGGLQTDAHRLIEEFIEANGQLDQLMHPSREEATRQDKAHAERTPQR